MRWFCGLCAPLSKILSGASLRGQPHMALQNHRATLGTAQLLFAKSRTIPAQQMHARACAGLHHPVVALGLLCTLYRHLRACTWGRKILGPSMRTCALTLGPTLVAHRSASVKQGPPKTRR
jgi:hypothetical protein